MKNTQIQSTLKHFNKRKIKKEKKNTQIQKTLKHFYKTNYEKKIPKFKELCFQDTLW